jgi:hypothetical protein
MNSIIQPQLEVTHPSIKFIKDVLMNSLSSINEYRLYLNPSLPIK